MKTTQHKHRRSEKRSRRKRPLVSRLFGTELAVIYDGGVHGIDREKDRAIRKALGTYATGSGFSFPERERDHSATVPEDDLAHVLGELKKIRGIRVKRLVQKWVRCR